MQLLKYLQTNDITMVACAKAIKRSVATVSRIANGIHLASRQTGRNLVDWSGGAVTYRDLYHTPKRASARQRTPATKSATKATRNRAPKRR